MTQYCWLWYHTDISNEHQQLHVLLLSMEECCLCTTSRMEYTTCTVSYCVYSWTPAEVHDHCTQFQLL